MRTDRPGQSALLFLDVLEILQRENVRYVAIGAFALAAHAQVRGTSDVDALLYTSPKELAKLRAIFERAGFVTTLRCGDPDDPIPSMLVLTDMHSNQVDLLGGLRDLDPKVFSRAVEVPFLGQSVRIVSREDFIAMKCFAGSPQDIEDARSAYRGAQGPVDLDLLRRVTRRFGRDAADHLEQLLRIT